MKEIKERKVKIDEINYVTKMTETFLFVKFKVYTIVRTRGHRYQIIFEYNFNEKSHNSFCFRRKLLRFSGWINTLVIQSFLIKVKCNFNISIMNFVRYLIVMTIKSLFFCVGWNQHLWIRILSTDIMFASLIYWWILMLSLNRN